MLKEASDRALPLVAVGLMYRQGYFRQRIDASGWQHEYWIDTDPDRAARRAGHRRRRRAAHGPRAGRRRRDVVAQIWRVDVGPRAAVPARHRPRRRTTPPDALDHRRGSTSATPSTRLAQYVAARRRRACGRCARSASSPASCTSTRATPRCAALELARADDGAGALARGRARRGARAHGLHHPHAGARRQRHLPGRPGRRGARRPRRRAGHRPRRELVRLGRTHPDDAHEPFGVTQFALRASRARQRRQPPPRRGGARDVARRCGPTAPVDDVPDRPRHQRRAHPHLDRRADARAARPPPRRRAGWTRADDPATWAPRRRDPRRRAVGGAPRPARRARRLRARRAASADRLGARRRRRVRRTPRPRAFDPDVLTHRLRPPRGHLQAARPADRTTPSARCGCSAATRPVQLVLAGKAHPRDEEAKRLAAARCSAQAASRRSAERVVFLDDYDLATARAPGARAATSG